MTNTPFYSYINHPNSGFYPFSNKPRKAAGVQTRYSVPRFYKPTIWGATLELNYNFGWACIAHSVIKELYNFGWACIAHYVIEELYNFGWICIAH